MQPQADQNANKWFVCQRPRPGARIRLFLFPFAGGGPAAFSSWRRAFPDEIETWAAHYPGRGSRHAEEPVRDIGRLVEQLADAIAPLLDKPFAFFGHSLGALVAFELARRLRRDGLPRPEILFLSACAAPPLPDRGPLLHPLPDPEFVESLKELNGIPRELLEQPELMRLLLPGLRADVEAFETYEFAPGESPLNVPIVASGGLEDPQVRRGHLEGWASHTSSGFELQTFPGGHFFFHTVRQALIDGITARLIRSQESPDCWSMSPAHLDLQPYHLDVWRIRLDIFGDRLRRLEAALSAEERERAARFHFPADRDRFIAAHGCLRDVLARYLRVPPDRLTFSVKEYGKPALQDHALEFNLSHSGDFALIAVTLGRSVGVDVERIRTSSSSDLVPRRFFSETEACELEALPLEQREAAFFRCWTRKEAYIKAQGLGLSLPLQSFDVSLAPGQPALLRATRPDPGEAARWKLFSLEIAPGYASAVAAEGQGLQLRLWDWNSPPR